MIKLTMYMSDDLVTLGSSQFSEQCSTGGVKLPKFVQKYLNVKLCSNLERSRGNAPWVISATFTHQGVLQTHIVVCLLSHSDGLTHSSKRFGSGIKIITSNWCDITSIKSFYNVINNV